MAAHTIRAVKVAVIGGAAIPVIGFTGQLSAASIDGDKAKPVRACDIPLYKKPTLLETASEGEKPEPNAVQVKITSARIFAMDVFGNVWSTYDSVKTKVQTGYEHSRATLDYVQTNPGELPRVGFISLATMGGFVLGYRGSILRKLLFANIAGFSSVALCYPKHTVDLSNAFKEDVRCLWRDNIGWPLDTEEVNEDTKRLMSLQSKEPKKVSLIKGDKGQSKDEDRDLYSTRS